MEKEIFASRGNRLTLGIFGCCNVGKSSLINSITKQEISVVSEISGTTTDVNVKAMEILPLGPLTIVDTPGIDDKSVIGNLRVKKAEEYISKVDLAIIVIDGSKSIELNSYELDLIKKLKSLKVKYLVVVNKVDSVSEVNSFNLKEDYCAVSALNNLGVENLIAKIIALGENLVIKEKTLFSQLKVDLNEGDIVVLVTPIDESAPKGRLILPQVETIRTLLDYHCIPMECQEAELKILLDKLKEKPKLVITDSQIFKSVDEIVNDDILLTSFSILFANLRGILKPSLEAIDKIERLNNGDRILVCEGCTHHRQCEDIGTVKIPHWIEEKTDKKFNFDFISGGKYPEDLTCYDVIIHCGGCMMTEKEMSSFRKKAEEAQVPLINYGILIAYLKGCLERALLFFHNSI